jgi:hypothetical protein
MGGEGGDGDEETGEDGRGVEEGEDMAEWRRDVSFMVSSA